MSEHDEVLSSEWKTQEGARRDHCRQPHLCNAEYADAFEQRFRERAMLVDQMPGFISNQILRPVNEGDPLRGLYYLE